MKNFLIIFAALFWSLPSLALEKGDVVYQQNFDGAL